MPMTPTGNQDIDSATSEIAAALRGYSQWESEQAAYDEAERLRDAIMRGTRELDAPLGPLDDFKVAGDAFSPEAYKTHFPGCKCPVCTDARAKPDTNVIIPGMIPGETVPAVTTGRVDTDYRGEVVEVEVMCEYTTVGLWLPADVITLAP